ncbi:tetratricopeptide repeat protein [Actinomadura nitritigenes]|uniref:tetratricopeptide repeat protein n=1 Tax=Actinomadura nitritigenes TaxID=134602 RepID=UPI003687102B
MTDRGPDPTDPTGRPDRPVFTQYVAAAGDGSVNAVQHGDQYNYIYRGAPPYRVEPFPLPGPATVLPDLARVPSRLLMARHQVVPYFPQPELDLLEAWREDAGTELSVRLIHGEGGQGKTRLAAEFAARSATAGWTVALARHVSEVAAADGGDVHLTVRAPGLVLVVDYAERWPLGDLVALVRRHRDAARDRLRVLLLARPAGAWWQGLAHQFAKLDVPDAEAVRMRALPGGSDVRSAMYAAARNRFAEIFDVPDPDAIAGPADFDDPGFASPLTLHMRALADVDAASRGTAAPTGGDQARLSSYLLDREHDHWRSSHDGGNGPLGTPAATMGKAVYVAVLTRPLPPADAEAALARAGVADTAPAREGILRDHSRCYPPADPALLLEPLYPDRLGEDFLALILPGAEDEAGYHATDPWTSTAPVRLLAPDRDGPGALPYTRQAVITLIETGRRWRRVAEHQVYPLLRDRPRLALEAGGTALASLAESTEVPVGLLEAIEPHVPGRRHVDLDVGIAALTRRLAAHRLATVRDPGRIADIRHELGVRLGYAGLHGEALEAIAETVDLYRRMAGTDPEAFEPLLATSLNDLCGTLLQLGRREEALKAVQESVAIRRRFADADPAAFESGLATSLHNLSPILLALERRDEALAATLEAVGIRRRLAEADPSRFEEDLAATLQHLGGNMWKLGRREEALAATQEAVVIQRRLAGADPSAFEPGLAATLNNLGTTLNAVGRRQEAAAAAGEAVDIRRRLARTNPAAFEPGLATSLNNLGIDLAALGRYEEAFDVAVEAVAIRRRLAAADPVAFEPDLALALGNLGTRLGQLGRFDEALDAAREAVDIRRRLAEAHPRAFEPELVNSLSNLSTRLIELDRFQEALAPGREAVDRYRRLAEAAPGAYMTDVAMSLSNLGAVLSETGRNKEAAAVTEESVRIYRDLAEATPGAYQADLAETLNNLAAILGELKRGRDALDAARESVDLCRPLAASDPGSFTRYLAMSLYTLSVAQARRRDFLGGFASIRESVALHRELAEAVPDVYSPRLEASLDVAKRMLWILLRWKDARRVRRLTRAGALDEAAQTVLDLAIP